MKQEIYSERLPNLKPCPLIFFQKLKAVGNVILPPFRFQYGTQGNFKIIRFNF